MSEYKSKRLGYSRGIGAEGQEVRVSLWKALIDLKCPKCKKIIKQGERFTRVGSLNLYSDIRCFTCRPLIKKKKSQEAPTNSNIV